MKPCIYCGTIKEHMREYRRFTPNCAVKCETAPIVDEETESFFICLTCLFDVIWMENNMLKHPPSEEFEDKYGQQKYRELQERLERIRDMAREARKRADDILEDE